MVLLLVAFRVNMEQRVQHRLLIDILKNPHIVVFEFVYDSLPAMWKEANTTESPDTLICGTLDQTFQNEFDSGWCWQVKCLCCPVDIYPLFRWLIYKHVPHVLKHICSISHVAVFLAKGIVVMCYRVTFVFTDTYTWWQWLLKTVLLLKNRACLCFIWQCGLDCCQKNCFSVSETKLYHPAQCCVGWYSSFIYDSGNSTGYIKIKLFLNGIAAYST